MAVLRLTTYGDPILTRKMRPVEDISDPKIQALVQDMFDAMYEEEGIGLAANQVGVDLNLMVIDITHVSRSDGDGDDKQPPVPEGFDRPLAFANGKILGGRGDSVMEEGCLSLPGIRVNVNRYESVRFEFQDLPVQHSSGTSSSERIGKREVSFEGLLARVIQHETDHVNGMVIVDRVSKLTRQRFSRELKDIAGHRPGP